LGTWHANAWDGGSFTGSKSIKPKTVLCSANPVFIDAFRWEIVCMRAAIYARYSTELQRAASIEDQVRLCKTRIAMEGWSPAGV
jgi:hypothetical protein